MFAIMQEVKSLRERSECWREPVDLGKKSDKLTFCIKLETLPPALMRWRVVRSQMGEQIEGMENVMDGRGLTQRPE